MTYEVGLSTSFVAFHEMPGVEGPEGELHSHDYRLDVVVSSSSLDERGMVCDLDVLDEALNKAVAIVSQENLELIRPPDVEAVTVEVVARWAHTALARDLPPESGLAVRVWESARAFGGYSSPITNS
jgi:6-pyruvoyltetrahydropterin/6-carboxytetrahydropterin synthase